MASLYKLESLLAEFELYEPELGSELRTSPHLLTLGAGRSELSFWEVSPLHHLSDGPRLRVFTFLAEALALAPVVRGAVLKNVATAREAPNPGGWQSQVLSVNERVERVRLVGPELELRYADRENRYQIRMSAPPLPPEQVEAALAWLAEESVLIALARGEPLDVEQLQVLGLMPPWDTLDYTLSTRSPRGLELGIKFACAAFAVYPAFLLVWRGLDGVDILRRFVDTRLARQHQDFAAAATDLPPAPEAFWAAPALPAVPAISALLPEAGLSAHLPPPIFWREPKGNQMLLDALEKVRKNLGRRLLKLTDPTSARED